MAHLGRVDFHRSQNWEKAVVQGQGLLEPEFKDKKNVQHIRYQPLEEIRAQENDSGSDRIKSGFT